MVALDPGEEGVGIFGVRYLNYSVTEHDGFKSLLSIRLNYELLMLAKCDNLIEYFKVLEETTEALGLGVESYQLADDDNEELVARIGGVLFYVGCRKLSLILGTIRSCLVKQMALLVIFEHEHRNDEIAMFSEQLVHGIAVVEKVLYDSNNLVAVLEVRREPVDVDDDVD